MTVSDVIERINKIKKLIEYYYAKGTNMTSIDEDTIEELEDYADFLSRMKVMKEIQ